MKIFVCAVLLVAVAAEPPRRQARVQFQRQEADPAPYPAAGYRPAKEFKLPTREELSPPSTAYGVPDNTYGAPLASPQNQYGTPRSTEKEVETIEDDKEKSAKLEESRDAEVVNTQGTYYVLLPGSQLQRVQFQTENDLRNMAYTARLQYKDEDRAPVFVYGAVQQPAAYVQQYQPAAYVQLV